MMPRLSGQGDDGLASATPAFDLVIIPSQVRAVALGDQRALYQRRAPEFAAAFGNSSGTFRFIGILHPRDNPEMRRQLPLIGKVGNVADHRKQNARAQASDPLDASQIVVPL